jgi:hypothetical protein
MSRRSYYSNAKNVENHANLFLPSVLVIIPAHLLAPSTSAAYVPATSIDTVTANNVKGYGTGKSQYTQYEQTILNIVQSITDRVSFDTILKEITPLQKQITSVKEAESTIYIIQNIILSVVENIRDRVALDIVLERLKYLKEEIQIAPCLPVVYDDIYKLLGFIIDSIGKHENLDIVLENLNTVKTTMIPDVKLATYILEIEDTIISTIDSIIKGVDLGIVLERLRYVKELLARTITYQNTL